MNKYLQKYWRDIQEDKMKIYTFVVLIFISFTPLSIVTYVGAIVALTVYVTYGKSEKTFLLRLFISFIIATCFTQVLGIVYWLLHVPLTIATAAIPGLIILFLCSKKTPSYKSLVWFDRSDVVALSVAFVSVLTLTSGALSSGGTLLQNMVKQATTGFDATQHISLTQTLYENKGNVFGPIDEVIDKVQYFNLGSYPQGWSLATSLWWQGLGEGIDIKERPSFVLSLFFASMMLWYGVMIFLFSRVILYVIEVFRAQKNNAIIYTGTIAFVVYCQLLFFIGIPYNGFVSFYPALVVPLVLIYFVIDYVYLKKISTRMFVIISSLLATGVLLSWLLAAPIAFVPVMAALIIGAGGFKGVIQYLIKDKSVLVVLGIVTLVALTTIYIQLAYGVKGLINWSGGSGSLNYITLSLFTVFSIVAALCYKRREYLSVVSLLISGGFLLSGSIYLYQYITNGQANYFSIKLTFVTLTVLSVFAISGFLLHIADRFTVKGGQIVGSLMVVSLIIFLPMATNLELGTSPQLGIGSPNYAFGKRFLSDYSASQVSQLIAEKKVQDANFVMYKNLGWAEDVTTTHFVHMLSKKPIKSCNKELEGSITSDWRIDRDLLRKCADGKDFYIIASSKNYDDLVDDFKTDTNIKVMLSN